MSLSKLRQAMIAYCVTQEGELPSEYQKVNKIRGIVPNAYIDTGISFNDDIQITIELDIAVAKVPATNSSAQIAGISKANDTYFYGIDFLRNTNTFRFNNGSASNTITPTNYRNRKKVTIGYSNGYHGSVEDVSTGTIDTVSISGSPQTISDNIYLNAKNKTDTGASSYQSLTLDWFGARLISGEGVVLRDYVMCYRKSNNKVGMYDKVNGEFYSSAGTSEFTIP